MNWYKVCRATTGVCVGGVMATSERGAKLMATRLFGHEGRGYLIIEIN